MKHTVLTIALCTCATGAMAASVTPTSYDMINGGTGSLTYYDDSYNGTGNTGVSYANLSGGTGDLTDGVIATTNWYVEPLTYVGWRNRAPQITFNFDQSYAFTSLTVYFDDSNGSGGVRPPSMLSALGQSLNVVDGPSGAPYSATLNLGGISTDQIVLDIQPGAEWVMVSEVTFDGDVSSVPLPASGVLLLGALGGLVARRRG